MKLDKDDEHLKLAQNYSTWVEPGRQTTFTLVFGAASHVQKLLVCYVLHDELSTC